MSKMIQEHIFRNILKIVSAKMTGSTLGNQLTCLLMQEWYFKCLVYPLKEQCIIAQG